MDKDLRYEALKDYDEICAIVEEHKYDDLGVLCELLGGHNLDDDMFDLNFKSLCVTINNYCGHNVVSDAVEVWDDEREWLAFDGSIWNLQNQVIEEEKELNRKLAQAEEFFMILKKMKNRGTKNITYGLILDAYCVKHKILSSSDFREGMTRLIANRLEMVGIKKEDLNND